MSKFKYLFAFLSIACIYSYNAEAKVCFLPNADGSENCLDGIYEGDQKEEPCPDCVYCKWPKYSATSCNCGDSGYTKYKQSDCCDDNGVACSAPKVCLTAQGREVAGCRSAKAYSASDNLSTLGTLGEYTKASSSVTICPFGTTCGCPTNYVTCPSNQVGVGTACDGKYTSCKCSSEYKKCGTNTTPSGASCTDSEGTKYTQCLCSASSGWKEINDCCGSTSTCTDHTGKVYYKCGDASIPDCACGYTYNNSCINGCTDSSYKHKNIIKQAGYNYPDAVPALKAGRFCANNIECSAGYWDATECMPSNYVSSSQACLGMGYMTTTCSGKYVGCPFNASMKKCLPE